MEQSPPWESNSRSVSKEIPCFLWNLKFQYHIHNSLPTFTVLNQIHPVHTFPFYIPKTHSNIVFSSMPTSSVWSLPFRFPTKILYGFLISHECYMHHPSHPPWFDHPNSIWWSVQVMKLLIMYFSPASHHFFPLKSKCNPQHPVLKQPQSIYLLLVWKTMFHTHAKQQVQLLFVYFNL